MHNCYTNYAYMHGYCSTYIYYFINFFSLLSLLHFPTLFSLWLQLLPSSSPTSPTPTSSSSSLALLALSEPMSPWPWNNEATRRQGFGSWQLQWVLNGSVRCGGGDEQVDWEICHSRSWWFVWWWWRWEDLRKFCLIYLKSELFGLWENLGKCLVCESLQNLS